MIELEDLETKLNRDGMMVSYIKGTSMFPLLREGVDKVVISRCDDYKLYDVVLYKSGNRYVLHRIVDIYRDDFIIRGDNTVINERVKRGNILGVLSGYYNESGYVEVNDEFNKECFLKSKKTLGIRKIKNKIRNVFKQSL